MITNDLYSSHAYRRNKSFKVAYNEDGEKTIYSSDIKVIVKSTTDSLATISIEKSANGRDYQKAIERAKNINYNYAFNGNELLLDSYLTTDTQNKFSNQEIYIILYLPEGTIVDFSGNTQSFLDYHRYNGNIVTSNNANHVLKILEDDIECLDCPIEEEDYKVEVDLQDEDSSLKINDEGLEISVDSANLTINKNGVKVNSNDVKVNIDEDGITIKSKDN
jgi:hypothetical protein